VDDVLQALKEAGYNSLKLSGDMSHEARDNTVRQFRDIEAKILIATDVVARGFDVRTVTLVINFDMPIDFFTRQPAYLTYLHRVGRSGRFGSNGAAFNFIDVNREVRLGDLSDREIMDRISAYFSKSIETIPAHNEDAFINALQASGLATKDAD
jgi:ATP-dependent RNA helicase DDX19/DBP5